MLVPLAETAICTRPARLVVCFAGGEADAEGIVAEGGVGLGVSPDIADEGGMRFDRLHHVAAVSALASVMRRNEEPEARVVNEGAVGLRVAAPQLAPAELSRAERNQTKGRSKTLPPRPSG